MFKVCPHRPSTVITTLSWCTTITQNIIAFRVKGVARMRPLQCSDSSPTEVEGESSLLGAQVSVLNWALASPESL